MWASAADIGERYAGTLSGAMNMTGQMTGAIAAPIIGALLTRGQPRMVFVVLSCGYLVAALGWLLIDATRRVTDPPAAAFGPVGERS